jgi:hypothetical protein
MAYLWKSVMRLGKPEPHSEGNDPETRNLQDGLWQIGAQAWHILVHENNNIGTYEDDEDKRSECVGRSLVEVATTSDRTTTRDHQVALLIPRTTSRLSATGRTRRSKLNVSALYRYYYYSLV